MREQFVEQIAKKHVANLGVQVQKALGMVQRDITEVNRYVSAETMRREVLEDILFEKSALLGGVSKEEFEKRFTTKIEEYKAEQAKQLENIKAKQEADKKAEEEAPSKPKIYLPGEV